MRTLFYLIAFALTMASCELIEAVMPVDFPVIDTDTIPVDTITNDSIVLPDTCAEYVTITEPKFITGVMQFDIMPDSIQWYYRNDPVDLLTLFPNHALYVSGINVSIIVFGTNEYSQWQTKIWARDGSGAKNYFSFGREREFGNRQQFNFLGALTYEEMLDLMPQILSARRFGFYNSGLTCEQAESLIQILKDHCVDGTDKIMDLRKAPCLPPTDLMAYLNDADFIILLP